MSLVRRIAPEQIRELRFTLPRDFNLSPNVLVALGPVARQWVEEHTGHRDSPTEHRHSTN
jgi:hypothetical protein